jgi:hypothetical protein
VVAAVAVVVILIDAIWPTFFDRMLGPTEDE